MSEGDVRQNRLGGTVLTSELFFSLSFEIPIKLGSSRKAAQMLCAELGLSRLNTVDVLHRTRAFGLIVTHQDGWRLV
jgi:hypothetical protein